jgi:hypothetical protein
MKVQLKRNFITTYLLVCKNPLNHAITTKKHTKYGNIFSLYAFSMLSLLNNVIGGIL